MEHAEVTEVAVTVKTQIKHEHPGDVNYIHFKLKIWHYKFIHEQLVTSGLKIMRQLTTVPLVTN